MGALSSLVLDGGFDCGFQELLYGPFHLFWNAGDLGQWLDPTGLGVTAIDGFDPFVATAQSYNGSGANPELLTSPTPPTLGTTWMPRVDTAGHPGASTTALFGHAAPHSGSFFAFGELLVNPASRRLFRATARVSAGASTYALPVPDDALFAGRRAFVQGFLLTPGSGITATNGLEVRFNCP